MSLFRITKEGVRQVCVSASSLQAMQRCARYAWQLLVLRRTIAGARPALDFGGVMHEALALRYKQCGADPVSAELQAAQQGLIAKSYESIELCENEYRHAGRAIEVNALYNEHYAQEPFKVLDVEHAFEVPMHACVDYGGASHELVYRGYWDGRIEDGKHRLVIDHKTTSRFDGENAASYWDGFQNSGQMKGYCWAASAVTGQVHHGALINLIVVRAPLKTPSRTAKPRTEFARREFYYTHDAVAQWRDGVAKQVQAFLRYVESEALDGAPPPMSESACTVYKRCQFLDACSQGNEAARRALLASGMYEDYKSPMDEAATTSEGGDV